MPVLMHGKTKVGGVEKEILPVEWFDLQSGEWRLAPEAWWLESNPVTGTVQARKVDMSLILHLKFAMTYFYSVFYLAAVDYDRITR